MMAYNIFDSHCDTILSIVDKQTDISKENSGGHTNIPFMREADFGCQVFACFASLEEFPDSVVERSDKLLRAAMKLGELPGLTIPESLEEFNGLLSGNGDIAVLLAIEGGEALGGEPEAVEKMKELGVRYITLAWADNELTGSAFGENRGLSETGKNVVAEMGSHKMLVDVSHISDAAFKDVIELYHGPIIASHSNSRAICSSRRNLTDEQIRKIADSGGVIGVNFVSAFLSEEASKAQEPIFKKYMGMAKDDPGGLQKYFAMASEEIAKTPQPPFESIADHVDHLVKVGGIECVGFGSDFDGFQHGPVGLKDCRDYKRIVSMLEKRGYSSSDLEKICWRNQQRVFAWTFEK